MGKITRRRWLATAGTATAAATAGTVLGQQNSTTAPRYSFQDISPRELLQRRHLPNVELITQDNQKVHFYTDVVKDKRVVIQFMFTRCKDICPMITHHLVRVEVNLLIILRDQFDV